MVRNFIKLKNYPECDIEKEPMLLTIDAFSIVSIEETEDPEFCYIKDVFGDVYLVKANHNILYGFASGVFFDSLKQN